MNIVEHIFGREITSLIRLDYSGGRILGKEIVSLIRLDYSDNAIQISGEKELTQYDREVHDALVTLYIDGGNEYITPHMIYRTMTGNPEAKLTPKQREDISSSLDKLMYSRLIINAITYDGKVIQGETATAKVNGVIVEVYHLLREPALYTYASFNGKISRLDIKLLNSPVNKNKETRRNKIMTIKIIPLDHKIDSLRAFRVEPDPCERVTKDFEWYAVRNAIADNFIKTDADAGAVGVIYDEEFFLVPNFHGDGLTRVGVIDELSDELKAQMHFMGYFHGKHLLISDYDCAVIPRPELDIEKEAWYACYSREGIVVFVKV